MLRASTSQTPRPRFRVTAIAIHHATVCTGVSPWERNCPPVTPTLTLNRPSGSPWPSPPPPGSCANNLATRRIAAAAPFVEPAGGILDAALARQDRAPHALRHQRRQTLQVRRARQATPARKTVSGPTRDGRHRHRSDRSGRPSTRTWPRRQLPLPKLAPCGPADPDQGLSGKRKFTIPAEP